MDIIRFRAVAVGAALVLVGGACSGNGEPGAPGSTEDASRPERSSTRGEGDGRHAAPLETAIRLRPVATGLDTPLYVTHAGDGSGRLFIVEQGGRIKILRNGRVRTRPFLDISDKVQAGGEQGLLGLAFDPDYPRTRRFFVNYTNLSGDTIVARYRVSDRPGRADPSSERVLLEIAQPFSNHNGGHLAFGPDGYLYVATGDGGSAGDPQGNGQSLDTLLGKLLRIDVAGRGYEVPPDNPFVDRDGARPEIWAYGLRNPWRFSFDRATGDLWIADVGQSELEEVNVERAPRRGGVNYGWNVMEGSACYEAAECDTSGLELPVAEYNHSQGCSITGGYVYRGTRVPALVGGYLYGDFCSGNIWILDSSTPRAEQRLALETERQIASFGENEKGELFVVDHSGTVLRVRGAN
jgi:glucose/arabinose dehydrogenase